MFKNPRLLSLRGRDIGLKTGPQFLPRLGCVSGKRGEDDDTCQMPWVPVSSLIAKGYSRAALGAAPQAGAAALGLHPSLLTL